MMSKKTVLVLFGGRSPEHDISIVTGLQIFKALDPTLYEAIPLYIAPNGSWLTGNALKEKSFYIPSESQMKNLLNVELHNGPAIRPYLFSRPSHMLKKSTIIEFDVAMLCFHGLTGEDGHIQGLFETANIPYTGMRTLASAVLMDKAATKRMLAGTDVPVLDFKEIHRPKEGLMISVDELQGSLGEITFPCCVKPSHLGSSIGVARVKSFEELSDTLPSIFRYDSTAILEPFVENLVEYNLAVCRPDGEVRTSAIERPKHSSELLDFKAKYLSSGNKGSGIKMEGTKTAGQSSEGMLSLTRDINPKISIEMERNLRRWATTIFEHVSGTGAPRLDFLSNAATGEIWFNEANPCPGSYGYFLWEAADTPILFSNLLDLLISEALRIHASIQLPSDPTPDNARLFARKN